MRESAVEVDSKLMAVSHRCIDEHELARLQATWYRWACDRTSSVLLMYAVSSGCSAACSSGGSFRWKGPDTDGNACDPSCGRDHRPLVTRGGGGRKYRCRLCVRDVPLQRGEYVGRGTDSDGDERIARALRGSGGLRAAWPGVRAP